MRLGQNLCIQIETQYIRISYSLRLMYSISITRRNTIFVYFLDIYFRQFRNFIIFLLSVYLFCLDLNIVIFSTEHNAPDLVLQKDPFRFVTFLFCFCFVFFFNFFSQRYVRAQGQENLHARNKCKTRYYPQISTENQHGRKFQKIIIT